MKTVQLQQIADEAGVSRATVSRALRANPKISPATRARVEAVARRLGWKENPFVSQCLSGLRRSGDGAARGAIAWLVLRPGEGDLRRNRYYSQLLQGARARAEQLGFGVELLHLAQEGMAPARLGKIIRARGIEGVILAPLRRHEARLDFPWAEVASVAIGHSLETPRLHRVSSHHVQDMKVALENLVARGARRIGLALPRALDEKVGHQWLGMYQVFEPARAEVVLVPPWIYEKADEAGARAWLARTRPEAVVMAESGQAKFIADAGGARVVLLSLLPGEEKRFWGLVQRSEQIAADAVDLVVNQILRGERGVPESPRTVLSEAVWRDDAP